MFLSSSKIGKYGLERAYKSVRAVNGSEIYIEDANGNKKTSIAKQEQKDSGEVRNSIINYKQAVYEQFKNNKCCSCYKTEDGRSVCTCKLPII